MQRSINLLKWYNHQEDESYDIGFNITTEGLKYFVRNNNDNTKAPPSTMATSQGQLHPLSFRQQIKVTLSDYPTLKEDFQWRTFNRQLQATAANHDTAEVLDPTYSPPDQASRDNFQEKHRFIYNFFSQNITTAKGKVYISS